MASTYKAQMGTKQGIKYKLYSVWIPRKLHERIEAHLATRPDIDRSKFIRRALRAALTRAEQTIIRQQRDDAVEWFEDFAAGEADG